MNAKKRYSLILISVILLSFCYFWGSKFRKKRHKFRVKKKSYIEEDFFNSINNIYIEPRRRAPNVEEDMKLFNSTLCTMERCFDFSRCSGRPFKVYVYPEDDNVPLSSSYSKILSAIKDSRFFTEVPEQACVFVLSQH